MNNIKEFRGKWLKKDEATGEVTSYLIFGEFMIKSWNFRGVNKRTGLYLTARKLIFIEKDRICFILDVSTSGDVLTLADSDGTIDEYVKCPDYVPINEALYSFIAHSIFGLTFLGLIASIVVLVLSQ